MQGSEFAHPAVQGSEFAHPAVRGSEFAGKCREVSSRTQQCRPPKGMKPYRDAGFLLDESFSESRQTISYERVCATVQAMHPGMMKLDNIVLQ